MSDEVKLEAQSSAHVRTVKFIENGVVKEVSIDEAPEEHIHGVTQAPPRPDPTKRFIQGHGWFQVPYRWNRTVGVWEETPLSEVEAQIS